MIEINGSEGEGGGQIIRSSLALSAVTGIPVQINNIRGGRKKPGLLRQHLTGVRAMTEICASQTQGAELGSQTLAFAPSRPNGGTYSFEVGSAGSAILVAQTILPALMMADQPTTVTLSGGTHAAWAPPYDFFERCYLPQIARMNARVSAAIKSHGFYPAGGGQIELQVEPTKELQGLTLTERIGRLRPKVLALVSGVPSSVGQREYDLIRRKAQWREDVCEVVAVERSGGPGNVVMIQCEFDNLTELFIGFGKVGIKAEQIARSTLSEARKYLASKIPVGTYLADQLLLPMGLAAHQGHSSRFRTMPLSQHSLTHIDILQRFLNIEISTIEDADGVVEVRIAPDGLT